MPAYIVAHRQQVTDTDGLKKYDHVDASIEKFGGEVVIRADSFDVLEGDWRPGRKKDDSHPERITIIRFPDMAALRRWYDSPDYSELKHIRQQSSKSDVIAVEATKAMSSGR